jgi:hypothetical protein
MDGLNKKRFFAFGCSYTCHIAGTWADYIGSNFKEYYNFGRGGACNTYIMSKFIEADVKYKFDYETDYIVVMFTNFNRFSYYDKVGWKLQGSVYKNETYPEQFRNQMWSEDWGIYNSWIAINTIKQLLRYKALENKLLMAMDSIYFEESPFDDTLTNALSNKFVNNIYNSLADSESLDKWKGKRYEYPNDYELYKKEDFRDAHPTQKMHYEFMKDKFPQFDTEKSKNTFELLESLKDTSSWHNQQQSYQLNFNQQKNKAFGAPLF